MCKIIIWLNGCQITFNLEAFEDRFGKLSIETTSYGKFHLRKRTARKEEVVVTGTQFNVILVNSTLVEEKVESKKGGCKAVAGILYNNDLANFTLVGVKSGQQKRECRITP